MKFSSLSRYRDSLARWMALLVLIGVSSCSQLNGPLDSSLSDSDPSSATTENAPIILTRRSVGERSVSAMISASEGGVLKLINKSGENGKYVYILQIPPGALGEDTQISMSLPSEEVATLDFGPEGLQFLKPARLIAVVNQDLRNVTIPGEADIYWHNPESDTWQAQGGEVLRLQNGFIRGFLRLHHFSRYSLGGDSPIQKMMYGPGWSYFDPYYGYILY